MRMLAFDNTILQKEGVRWDRLKFMIDFDMTMQLLARGHDNVIVNSMVHNQYGSNATGGCSQYRTQASQEADAVKLQQLWGPEFVTLVRKETKTAWGWGTRADVRIYWKKLYETRG
jgi:hypothetical protein